MIERRRTAISRIIEGSPAMHNRRIWLVWADIALVLAFVLLGGFFAAAELALVSLRPGQVSRLAAGGRRGRQVAKLLEDPNRFLSAVQIGVTLAGMFSSAVGAVALAAPLAAGLTSLGVPAGPSYTLSLVIVTVLVAYVSLVFGELAPKRLALQRAEAVARFSAGPLTWLARATRPVIWLLGKSTDLVVRLAGGRVDAAREAVTEEELRDIVASSSDLSPDERRLIGDVLDAADRPVRSIMVPRLDVSALPVGLTLAEAMARTADRPYSRYPVVDGTLDDVVGFVHLRDLFTNPPDTLVRDLVRPVMRLPHTRRALPALAEMRRTRAHLAVVMDEYGGADGIITLEDLLEELVGDIADEFDADAFDAEDAGPSVLQRDDVDAQLRLGEFAERTGVLLPEGPYDTAAGWMLHSLGRIPRVGDAAEFTDGPRRVRLTVTRMLARRVEGLRVEDRPVEDRPGDGLAAASPPGSDPAADDATDEQVRTVPVGGAG